MTAFSNILATARKPPRVVVVPHSAFADTWEDKPAAAVRMGLRLISEDDVQTARAEAAKTAWAMHDEDEDEDGRVESFNDALMRWAVARATSQPEDVALPWFEMAEETVKVALTSDGVRFLFGELEMMMLAESPLAPEATEADVCLLVAALGGAAPWGALSEARARRLRRLLAYCLSELRGGAVGG